MWNFASNCLAGNVNLNHPPKNVEVASDESDDEVSSVVSVEEGLECPICWESFNIVENVPYVLWCGHTLCKNCILGLQWAVVKFPTLPIQLPLFISCPWCNILSFRLVYRGNLKFPSKNYFVLWMVESKNGDRDKNHSTVCKDHDHCWTLDSNLINGNQETRRKTIRGPNDHLAETSRRICNRVNDNINLASIHLSLRKSLVFFCHLTAKFPLVIVILLIILYAIPASAVILALYILITVLFAIPSFLVLYFAYPSLDWLFREIAT